jgi:signal transduction histidine kinase
VTERVRAENDLKQSREELRELSANLQNVREEEKTRIARELHDDLGQQLTALKMDLSALEHMVGPESGASADVLEQLRSMRRLIDATVASVRRIAADLRPVMLDDLGLLPAIDWLAGDFTHRYGIEVDRRIAPGGTNFSRTSATTLFRIVQEALTNVAKHAEATRVELMLRMEGNYCVLRVSDNGRGSHPAGADGATTANSTHFTNGTNGRAGKSFGIIGIRERAHMLGGSVAIDTADGKGFALTVTFPREAVQQEETLS